MEGLLEGVRRAAAIGGEQVKDERKVMGLEVMLHTARAWGWVTMG